MANGGQEIVNLIVFKACGYLFSGQFCNRYTVKFPIKNSPSGSDIVFKILVPEPGTYDIPLAYLDTNVNPSAPPCDVGHFLKWVVL